MLWVGTSPSALAAPASRQPATRTRPDCARAGAQEPQSRYGSSGCGASSLPVGLDRAGVRERRGPRRCELVVPHPFAQQVEQVPVRRLRAVPERPPEVVQQDDAAAFPQRGLVPPEPEGMAEAHRRGGDRVQRLARLVQRSPRQRHEDRVHRAVERDAPQRDPSQKGLGVRDGRRARQDGGRAEDAPHALERVLAKLPRQRVEEAPHGGVREGGDHTGSRRVAAIPAGRPWMVEQDRHPGDRRAASECSGRSAGRDAPRRERRREERRGRRRLRDVLGRAGIEERAGAPSLRRLGGCQHHDQVGVEKRSVDVHRAAAVELEGLQVRTRRVVHDHRAAEVTRLRRGEDALPLAAAGAAFEPAGDEDRLLLGPHAEALELVADGAESGAAGVSWRIRERERGGLDDNRRRCRRA